MNNGFEPRFLICSECNEEFVFTIQAQEYFSEQGFMDDPKRCKTCHTKYKKSQRNNAHVSEHELQYPE
ncbi:MAG: cytochrome C551 [Calditrichaeota bacterium]|nr:MAG: cytochrome C551 [Calditrichota bacterium]